MSSRPWLPRVRKLLGTLPDEAVAKRAGVAQTTVTRARQALGIPARRGRALADYAPADVLRLVRARGRSGRSMRGAPGAGSRR